MILPVGINNRASVISYLDRSEQIAVARLSSILDRIVASPNIALPQANIDCYEQTFNGYDSSEYSAEFSTPICGSLSIARVASRRDGLWGF